MLIRGGTSKGAYFLAASLPAEPEVRDRVLLAALGSPDPRQVDGIGGADPLTSKVAIVGRSSRPDADVDYLFAQVAVDRPAVDTSVSCGNLLAGVGPFAIEVGLVPARDPETLVRIHTVNTGGIVEAVVQTPRRRVRYHGEAAIDGVPGTSAPVLLSYGEVAGSKTGSLLPTGSRRDRVEGVDVTCIDAAVPVVVIPASALGKTGNEEPGELNGDAILLDRIETIRRSAGRRMGLGDVRGKVMPKVALVSTPSGGCGIRSRYFVPQACHAAHAVTGAIAVACCAVLEGSVADGLARVDRSPREQIVVEHPSGVLSIDLETERDARGPAFQVRRAALLRTARLLFRGNVLIPSSVWSPSRAVRKPSPVAAG
jgi:2-methylaconitate cis-trans-isomerase PrpF